MRVAVLRVLAPLAVVTPIAFAATSSTSCTSECSPDANGGRWDDARLRSRADVATGIYGIGDFGCGGAHCNSQQTTCLRTTLDVTSSARRTSSIAITGGTFRSSLSPGTYSLCLHQSCVPLAHAAGQLVRVEVHESDGYVHSRPPAPRAGRAPRPRRSFAAPPGSAARWTRRAMATAGHARPSRSSRTARYATICRMRETSSGAVAPA